MGPSLVGRSLSMAKSEWKDWKIMAESLWVDTMDKEIVILKIK